MTQRAKMVQNIYITSSAIDNAYEYYQNNLGPQIEKSVVSQIVKEHENLLDLHTNQPDEISEWYNSNGSLMVIEYLSPKLENISEPVIELVVEGIEDYINQLV